MFINLSQLIKPNADTNPASISLLLLVKIVIAYDLSLTIIAT